MDAFRLDPTQQTPTLHSGNGGFALVAESDQPILQNLNSPEGQAALGFSAEDQKTLAGSTIVSLRVHAGEDASCLNLYRPRQPRVIGVPRRFIDRDGFAWADTPRQLRPVAVAQTAGATPCRSFWKRTRPTTRCNCGAGWARLSKSPTAGASPSDSAWSPYWPTASSRAICWWASRTSCGSFPTPSGCRFFLVKTPPANRGGAKDIARRSRRVRLFGRNDRPASGRISCRAEHLPLDVPEPWRPGALLGTFGLAAVQLRNVFERRGELALLRRPDSAEPRSAGWCCWNTRAVATGLGIGTLAACWPCCRISSARGVLVPWALLAATLIVVFVVGLAAGGRPFGPSFERSLCWPRSARNGDNACETVPLLGTSSAGAVGYAQHCFCEAVAHFNMCETTRGFGKQRGLGRVER